MEIHISLTVLDYIVIAAYVAALLAIGFWVSFKKDHEEDLFLAGRSLSWPNIGLSIFGTNVSPSMMIASCGIAYTSGMVAGNFEWLAWVFLFILGMVFIPHYLNTKISTMPEFMNFRFGKSSRTFVVGYTIFSILVLWLGSNLYAGGILLSQVFNWPLWLSLVFLMVIATSFTVTGGLAAVVITDSFQSILIILASVVLTIIGLVKVGSIDNLVSSVPSDYWTLFRPIGDEVYPWHAIVLGYPVMGIWFWCTEQTIVQRVLGGKDIRHAQMGTVMASYLKIFTPLIFFLPGIICKILHPDLSDSNEAYMTMVTQHLPLGFVGLIIAVLIAALISTIDSGLNSLSTVFTLDIYCQVIRKGASAKERILVGRIITIASAVLAIFLAILISAIKGFDLFSLIQSIIGFLAPPMAAVFLLGVLWKRATSAASISTLVLGSMASIGIGIMYLSHFPSEEFWPHFLLLSFYIFVGLVVFMVIVSLLTKPPLPENRLPSIKEAYANIDGHTEKKVLIWWGALAIIMFAIYFLFQYV
jgi:solute:Na+ symporter, SSS family